MIVSINGAPHDFEDLAIILHPMACVAWDRDCAEIILDGVTDHHSDLALRFITYGELLVDGSYARPTRADAYSGPTGNVVAVWYHELESWKVLQR